MDTKLVQLDTRLGKIDSKLDAALMRQLPQIVESQGCDMACGAGSSGRTDRRRSGLGRGQMGADLYADERVNPSPLSTTIQHVSFFLLFFLLL